ncbi:MAG: alpha/beta hydrolase [Pseudomonadales bacterium]
MPVPDTSLSSHSLTTGAHVTHYLAAGPEDGPLVVFVHGWPELSLSWRHQLPVLAGLGFRAIAPDMRGYGRSSVYPRHEDYAQELVVADMIGLLDALGGERAVWVGHDWGSPTVWNIASHHPDRCHGVANLCVPYFTLERGLDACLPLVNRDIYPESQFPAGQWEYQLFYQEQFEQATRVFGANAYNTVKLLFRKGDPRWFRPASRRLPAMTRLRAAGSTMGEAPDLPMDDDVVTGPICTSTRTRCHATASSARTPTT